MEKMATLRSQLRNPVLTDVVLRGRLPDLRYIENGSLGRRLREVALINRGLLVRHLRNNRGMSGRRRRGGSGRRRPALGGKSLVLRLSDHLLRLGAVLISVNPQLLLSPSAVLRSKILELRGLLVQHPVGLPELLIDELLVLDVDEGAQVDDDRGNQAEAPERKPLDEEVGDERGKEALPCTLAAVRNNLYPHSVESYRFNAYRTANVKVLNEDDALELNDEEVDELLEVVRQTLQRVLPDHVVLARTHLRSETTAESSLASNLGERGACHYCQIFP